MKTIYKIFVAVAMTFAIVSCETEAETVAEVKTTAGVILTTGYSDGAILGVPMDPNDLPNSGITFNSIYLDFDARFQLGNEAGIEKFELVKTFNGGAEIYVSETTSLPLNKAYTTIAEYLDGTGVAETDLRIGDTFTFKVKAYKNDGTVLYYSTALGQFNVVVNCSSALAGDYEVAYNSGNQVHTLTELSPGLYEMSSMFGWPTSGYVVKLQDVCGQVEILNDWQFSNTIGGTGLVQPNGDIIFTDVEVEAVYSGNTFTLIKI